jgi:nucleoid-associated protein YgaU
MRKDVTLGMSIGGVVLAVVIVVFSLSGHHKTSHHPVDTGSLADSNAGGDGSGQATPDAESGTADAPPKSEISPTTEATAPPVAAKTDDKPAVVNPNVDISSATKPADSIAGAATADKQDPIWGGKLWGNSPTPLLGVSSAPDPNAAAADKLAAQATGGTLAIDAPKPPEAVTSALTIPPNIAATQPSPGAHTHTVQKGETFSTIAATAYGSANFYPYLMRANPNIDPKALRPGMVIAIPDIAAVKPAEKTPVPAAGGTTPQPTAVNSYVVQPGDNLNKIAIKKFGKVDMVSRIYELNKQLIGDDPAKLKVGMVLNMPTAATAATAH